MKKNVFSLFLLLMLFQVGLNAQCTVPAAGNSGIGTFVTSDYNYINCHRYIRTALLNNSISLYTGDFVSSPTIHPSSSSIASDDRFVIVCDKNDAQAICFSHLSGQPDHSALVLYPGVITGATGPFASTPGPGSSVYRHGEASIGSGGGTLLNYFAVVPEITGDNSIPPGDTKTYCIANMNFIESIAWSTSSSSLEIIGSANSFCVDVKANCLNGSGTYTLTATITIKGTGESRDIKTDITITCPQVDPCQNNTLDGGPLYTFNYITPGVMHTIQMALPWSWTLSSGTPQVFQVLNGGQTVNLQISSKGCVTLYAYNYTCGFRHFTFCPGSFMLPSTPEEVSIQNSTPDVNDVLDVKVFPNPVSSEVQIQYNGDSDIQLSIYNTLGQLVQEHQNPDRVSVQHLENGTYLFEIRDLTTQERVIKRIVVAK